MICVGKQTGVHCWGRGAVETLVPVMSRLMPTLALSRQRRLQDETTVMR